MPTFKSIVEPHYKRKDGTYNIKIRVIHHDNKKTYISTPWYVTKQDLRGNFEIKTTFYKDLVEDKIREYRKICDKIPSIESLSLAELVNKLKNYQDENSFRLNFIEYLTSENETLKKQGRKGVADLRQTTANSLELFVGSKSLDVNKLTSKFLQDYIDSLKGENGEVTRKCSLYPGLIRKALNDLRAKYNDVENGIVRITVNPFAKIRLEKQSVAPKKRALSVEEIQRIIDHKKFDTKREEQARDVFLLSFLLIGINSADLYTCTDYSDGILTYNRKKIATRRDDKGEMKVKVEPEVLSLIEKYKNRNKSRQEVFDFCNEYADTRGFNKALNKGLKVTETVDGEEKPKFGVADLQFYAARHSWATIARNVAGIDKYTVHEALNHADSDMKVTDIYINRDFSNVWKANRKVLDLFDWTNL
ncbi:MAG: site-specific integrase [Bacteroidales bacterium]|nr:site-specific integrase [Bacteroidales bacterium]